LIGRLRDVPSDGNHRMLKPDHFLSIQNYIVIQHAMVIHLFFHNSNRVNSLSILVLETGGARQFAGSASVHFSQIAKNGRLFSGATGWCKLALIRIRIFDGARFFNVNTPSHKI
jgi:hypothetical protein